MNDHEIHHALLHGQCSHPHDVLSMHPRGNHLLLRAFLQDAIRCDVVDWKKEILHPMERVADEGIFLWISQKDHAPFPYRLRATYGDHSQREFEDAYRFLPTISDFDCHLFGEGRSLHIHRLLGSHRRIVDGVNGISFALWAPAARRVSVVGDFNRWDGRYFPMRPIGSSGIWEIFIPNLPPSGRYKYELIDCHGRLQLRSDPYGRAYDASPHHASIWKSEKPYQWHDDRWMAMRSKGQPFRQPISIYEVHLGSWKRVPEEWNRSLNYGECAHQLADYCVHMGFTHVELLPICEFPFDGSWGYQTTGFFAPTHRHGIENDFKYFVDTLHRSDIGVILDWVPSHFPKDRFALAQLDGTCLYEYADSRKGEHYQWGTLVFDYGRNEVRNFLLASALHWLENFHIDGFRVDAVSSMLHLDYMRKDKEWIPNHRGGRENYEAIEFLKEFNVLTHRLFPGIITIAEEATSFPRLTTPVNCGGIGFDFKWNMGWMHDTLRYFSTDSLWRKNHHHQLTFAMLYQYSEHFMLALSHDEVVHGKSSLLGRMPSHEIFQKAQMLRSLYGYMWTWPGKKTLFMGSEFGQYNEWYYATSLDWHLLAHSDHRGIQRWIRDLNYFYRRFSWLGYYDDEPCGFQWIDADDANHSVFTYLRCGKDPKERILVACNFTFIARNHYRVGIPLDGIWEEILNSDAREYGGHGFGNWGKVYSKPIHFHGMPHSIDIFLPSNSVLIFQWKSGK